jgi:hypothetical protein
MNVNDLAHLTEELLERLLASDDIETQRLLRLAGVSELYCRQRRDAIIIWCLRQGRDRVATNDELYRMNEPPLLDADWPRRSGDDDYGRTADHARHDARRRLLRRTGAGGRRIRRHRNGEPRWSRAVRAQEDAAAAGETTYELPDMFVVVYDYVDGETIDHYVGERDDDNGDGVYGSDVAISLILRGREGELHVLA